MRSPIPDYGRDARHIDITVLMELVGMYGPLLLHPEIQRGGVKIYKMDGPKLAAETVQVEVVGIAGAQQAKAVARGSWCCGQKLGHTMTMRRVQLPSIASLSVSPRRVLG